MENFHGGCMKIEVCQRNYQNIGEKWSGQRKYTVEQIRAAKNLIFNFQIFSKFSEMFDLKIGI